MKTIQGILFLVMAVGLVGGGSAFAGGPMGGGKMDASSASTSLQSIEGKLLKIDGDFYIVEDASGKQARLHVSQDTIIENGPKKVGDMVRAKVTKSGHATTIQ